MHRRIHYFLGLLLLLFCLLASPGRITAGTQAMDFAAIDSQVETEMHSAAIPGLAYAIVKDGEVVHLAAFGKARRDGAPMTPQTPLRIGSITKTMTGLAIRQLVVAGLIDVNAPVTRYLPWFTLADKEAAEQIRISHLLNHTSGISNADGANVKAYQPGLTSEELVRSMTSIHLNRPIGSSREYSNLNFVVLGEVVRAVSGQPYEQYVQEHIFSPLGMTHTYTSEEKARIDSLADGYRIFYGFPVNGSDPFATGMMPAGFVMSSAEDMARYAAAFTDHGLWQDASIVTPDGKAEPGNPVYGIYWEPLGNTSGDIHISHSGSTLAFYGTLYLVPLDHLAVVVLTNTNTAQVYPNTASAYTIASDIIQMVKGISPSGGGVSVRTLYIFIDFILLAGLFGIVRFLLNLRRWRSGLNIKPEGRKQLTSAVGTTLLGLVLLVILPFLLELLVGGTVVLSPLRSWPLLFFVLPDIFIPIFGMILILLAGGVLKLAWLGRKRQPEKVPVPGITGSPASKSL